MRLGKTDPADTFIGEFTCNECKHKDDCPDEQHMKTGKIIKFNECAWAETGKSWKDKLDIDRLLD